MTQIMNREDVIVRVVAELRLRPGLAGVEVDAGWPGDELREQHVWVGDVEGDIGQPTAQAGRLQRDDEFELPLAFHVAIREGLDATRARLGALMAEVESWFADPALVAGVVPGVLDVRVTRVGSTAVRAREGAVAKGGVMVAVHTRLT